MTLVGSEALVVAQINAADVPVVLDSGATFGLVSYGEAARLHLNWHSVRGHPALGGVGGTASTLLAFAFANVRLGAARAADARFVVSNLPAGPAAAIIGRNILDFYDLDYDLRARLIELMRPHGCERVPPIYWRSSHPYSAADFDRIGNSPTVLGYIDGVATRIMFDTGASTTVLDIRAAARAGVKEGMPGTVAGGRVLGVAGHAVQTWVVPISSVRIGDEEIRNTRLRIGELALAQTDMVLGTDFFLSHHVYVANGQQKVYFTYEGGPVFDVNRARGNDK